VPHAKYIFSFAHMCMCSNDSYIIHVVNLVVARYLQCPH